MTTTPADQRGPVGADAGTGAGASAGTDGGGEPGGGDAPGGPAPPVAPAGVDLDRPVRMHDLAFLDEGGEVTVGRHDIDSYAIFPPDGAELLRRLAGGLPPGQAARWYAATYGEQVDMAEFVAALAELGFLRTDASEQAVPAAPLRWTRLGRALFSPPAWACYAALVVWAAVATARSPGLLPGYRHIFFTRYFTVVELVLFGCQIPLMLLHEAFHALAGRRLGLRSTLRIGRRFTYIVLETSLDGLVTVPRRRRYLPMLAGILLDVVVIAAFTLAADLTRRPDGRVSAAGSLCLAIAFMTVLRVVWQFSFFLQTDLYHVVSTTLGCVDLHTAARRTLRNRFYRLSRRPDRMSDESLLHPRDRAVARWYSWLLVVGYGVSLAAVAFAALPAAYRFLGGVFGRFGHSGSAAETTDSLAFLGLNLAQTGVLAVLVARDRRRASTTEHVLS